MRSGLTLAGCEYPHLRAGAGTFTAMHAGRENSLCGQLNVEPKHMNLISSKIAKHVDVLKLFASNAFRPVIPEQLLHHEVTTHSCETLAHALVMW